jgi:hypothetical protein
MRDSRRNLRDILLEELAGSQMRNFTERALILFAVEPEGVGLSVPARKDASLVRQQQRVQGPARNITDLLSEGQLDVV